MLEDTSSVQGAAQRIQSSVADLFSVHDVTLGIPGQVQAIRLRGTLQLPSDQAFPQIAARLRGLGYTAMLRRDPESGQDVLLAVPGVLPEEGRQRYWLHGLLFGATVLTTLYVGAGMVEERPPDDLWWPLFNLWQGWPFALSLLSILLAHEMGHYFVSRRHGVPRSLPYFIPLPIPEFLGNVLGTLGAVIVMKAPVTNRRVMLDTGAAGPLVGLVVAIPVLLIGLSLSHVEPMPAGQAYMLEGSSLLYMLLKYLVFGQWLPAGGLDVFIHPVAFAGWAGLLVTCFNLIPAGQFDGGHTLYSVLGDRAQRLTWPIIAVLVALGLLVWPGWFIWAALVFLTGQRHPGPLDDVTRLDGKRKLVAALMLVIFVLTFTPMPLTIVAPEAGQSVLLGSALALGAIAALRRTGGRLKANGARLALLACLGVLALALAGCGAGTKGTADNPLLMSFISSGDAQEIRAAGDELARMLSDRTGLTVRAGVGADMAAVREALCSGKASVGWLNTFHYALAHEACGVDVSLVSVRFDAPTYRSQIIVRADSGIQTLSDLKGKVMCWVDSASIPYYGVPRILLKGNALDPDTDFARTVVAGSNANVVTAVYRGDCDAGATYVDARDAAARDLPDVKDKVAVLATTGGVPNDGVAFARGVPEDERRKIVAALLDVAGTDAGREVLRTLCSIDGLQEAGDTFYDPFRADLSLAGIGVQDLVK